MMEETGFSEKKLLMKEKYVRKSYGTIVQTRGLGLQSPSTISYIRHDLSPEDTLQGIALKYGVTMEQIKRANRLLTTDSIFMRAYLLIPTEDEDMIKRSPTHVVRSQSLQSDMASSGSSRSTTEPIVDTDEENRRDIENFLSKVDSCIASTKRNLEETRKHSNFTDSSAAQPDEYDDVNNCSSSSGSNNNGSRITYEGAYQSLNRATQHHPDRRRIRNSLHRLEQEQDELFEL